MFKTAKNTVKKAAKDQVEFFLVLLTGMFVGSILTLAYVKYDIKTSISFADIGGMLAGAGTAGLLVLAWFTADSWKKQQKHSNKYKRLDEFYDQCFNAFQKLESWHHSRLFHNMFESEYKMPPYDEDRLKMLKHHIDRSKAQMHQSLEEFLKSESQLERIIIKLDKDFEKPYITGKVLIAFKKYSSDIMEASKLNENLDLLKDEYHTV
jgi:hypothetical protein